MNFITIEHKDGAITLSRDHVERIYKDKDCTCSSRYYVMFNIYNHESYELTEAQYDNLLKYFV